MNKIIVYLVLVASLIVISMNMLQLNLNSVVTMHSTEACCSITVERLDDSSALVSYMSNNSKEDFEMYVEVEYPDADYTTAEQLQFEIEYAVNEMQEYCYHYHGE